MKSPFPGMDPYLEPHWLSVHPRLVVYAADQLAESLPPELCAVTQERVLVEAESEHYRRKFYPDVYISRPSWAAESGTAVADEPGTAVAEPLIIRMRDEPIRQSFIEIIDVASGGRVVSVVEFVSPTNKQPGTGRDMYRQKQQDCVDARVNVVEIDLTRAGRRRLLVPSDQVPPSHDTAYQACVWRANKPAEWAVYAIPLREPLPNIPVPLRPNDPESALKLQSMIERVYAAGHYERRIDYAVELHPPLDAEDQTWAAELLASHTREKT